MKFLKNRPSKRNIQFITLAQISYVDASLMFRTTIPLFCTKLLLSAPFQDAEFPFQLVRREASFDSQQYCSRIVFHHIAHEDAERGKRSG